MQVLGADFVAGSLGGALAAAVTTPLDAGHGWDLGGFSPFKPRALFLLARRCWAPTLWRAAWAARWRLR